MPQGRQVTQLNGQYVDEDPALLADLDLLAWGLLATLKSASASQKPDQQSQIAKSNVAVCCLDGSHYVVACNGVHDATYTMVPNAAMSLQDLAIRATVKDEVVVEATDKLGELVQEKKKLYSVTHRGPDQKLRNCSPWVTVAVRLMRSGVWSGS